MLDRILRLSRRRPLIIDAEDLLARSAGACGASRRIAGEMSHVALEEHLELHPFGRFTDIGTASPTTSTDCREHNGYQEPKSSQRRK